MMDNLFRNKIRGYNDFPKKGVVYWDFTPILEDPELRCKAVEAIVSHFRERSFTTIACIEAKGFVLGSLLAREMQLPMVLIRKPGLTPGRVMTQSFTKEYGKASYEIGEGKLKCEDRVLVVYDILAGSGASQAAISLIEESGAQVRGLAYAVELSYLNGRNNLSDYDLYSLVTIHKEDQDAVRTDQL